jgi:hypothetical protein
MGVFLRASAFSCLVLRIFSFFIVFALLVLLVVRWWEIFFESKFDELRSYAFVNVRHTAVMGLLLDAGGAAVDAPCHVLLPCGESDNGESAELTTSTALDWAVQSDSLEAVNLLLCRGSKLDLQDGKGNTPLLRACRCDVDRSEIIQAGRSSFCVLWRATSACEHMRILLVVWHAMPDC